MVAKERVKEWETSYWETWPYDEAGVDKDLGYVAVQLFLDGRLSLVHRVGSLAHT